MPAPAIILGQLVAPMVPHLVRFGHEKAVPAIEAVLTDPSGFASRVGDMVIWNGSGGQQVLAGLQTLGESQQRIEQAVTSIESAQIATNAALSGLQTVSFATLGVASLTGGIMLWRLEALNKRFDRLSQQVRDLEDNLDAQNKAHLRNSIQKLREFDDTGDESSLVRARDEAQHAANVYGQLTYKECQSAKPRLDVLNYRGRCYLMSLVTELRTRLLGEQPTEAISRFSEEKDTIEQIARATFDTAIGENPSAFLSDDMKVQGTTLDLMTEIYQSAQRIGVFTEAQIRNPSDMFEYCRAKGVAGKSMFKWGSKKTSQALTDRLRYLMACLEDIGRAESLKLLADELRTKAVSFKDFQGQMKTECESKAKDHDRQAVFAYSFA
ncbi:MAG: hypothetical protein Q7Q71_00710 [Verrucomicrobiota bacterium JB023]|nr:hypothetical protein [Verrucomicrobiota bacterium JB023]